MSNADRPAHIPADQWGAMTADERAAMTAWEAEMGRTAPGTATDRYRVTDRETGEQIAMAVEDEAGIERRAELNPGHDYVNVRTGRIVEPEATPVLSTLGERLTTERTLGDEAATTLARYGATPRPRRTEGAYYTAPNTYGHPVRFWARDAEHAAFVAKRAHLRADGVTPEAPPAVAQAAPFEDHSPAVAHAIERLNDTAFVSKARLAELEALEARVHSALAHVQAADTPFARTRDEGWNACRTAFRAHLGA